MSSGEKKFIIWLGIALASWRLLSAIPVQDALFRFVAMGIVPGTHVTLTPHQVYLILASVFALSLVLVFWKELRRSVSRHGLSDMTAEIIVARQRELALQADPVVVGVDVAADAALAATPMATPETPKFITFTRPKTAKLPTTPLPVSPHFGRLALPALYIPLPRINLGLVRRNIVHYIRRVAKRCQRAAKAAYQRTRKATIIGWKITKRNAIRWWRWAEPRIRHADRYIDKTLHRNRLIADILDIAGDCYRAAMVMARKLQQSKH